MDKQPTEEQIKKFWGWCGFTQLPKANKGFHYEHCGRVMNYAPPNPTKWDMEYGIERLPRIDLNNLFKYAVPKLNKRHIFFRQNANGDWYCKVGDKEFKSSLGSDPALALFWAIMEVIDGQNK